TGETIDERRLAETQRLHLGAGELDPALEDLDQRVVVSRLAVGRDRLVVGAMLGVRHEAQATRRGSDACRPCRRRRPRRWRPRAPTAAPTARRCCARAVATRSCPPAD